MKRRLRTGGIVSSNVFGLNFRATGAPLLYVFDFDQTILAIHSFGSRIREHVGPRHHASQPPLSLYDRPTIVTFCCQNR